MLSRLASRSIRQFVKVPHLQAQPFSYKSSTISITPSIKLNSYCPQLNQSLHPFGTRCFSSIPFYSLRSRKPGIIVKNFDQFNDHLNKIDFFDSPEYVLLLSRFHKPNDEETLKVFNILKKHKDVKEFVADYLFKMCDYDHKGYFQLSTLSSVLNLSKNDENEFMTLFFCVLDNDHSGSLSKPEATRIWKMISIFIFFRFIALSDYKIENLNNDTHDELITEVNLKRLLIKAMKTSLSLCNQEEFQNKCFQSFKRVVESEKFEDDITIDEFVKFTQLKNYHLFDNLNDVINQSSKTDLHFCHKLPNFVKCLENLHFFETVFPNHIHLMTQAFPLFFGSGNPHKAVSEETNIIQFFSWSFYMQQKGFYLMKDDVQKYVNILKNMKSPEEVISFYFKNYSNYKGELTSLGISHLIIDAVDFRRIYDPESINNIQVSNTLLNNKKDLLLKLATKFVNSDTLRINDFSKLIKSQEFFSQSLNSPLKDQ